LLEDQLGVQSGEGGFEDKSPQRWKIFFNLLWFLRKKILKIMGARRQGEQERKGARGKGSKGVARKNF